MKSNKMNILMIFSVLFFLTLMVTCNLFLISVKAQDTAQIHGTVTDAETGIPIEGAVVYVYKSEEGYTTQEDDVHQTQTDSAGYYEVDCGSGEYVIFIGKDGYISYNEAVSINGQLEYDVELIVGEGGGEGYGTGNDGDYDANDDYTEDVCFCIVIM